MKFIFTLFISCFLFSCSEQPSEQSRNSKEEELMSEEQTIELTYIAWACDCANWATTEDMKKFSGSDPDSLAERCIFLEAAADSIEFPDTMDYNGDLFRFTGRFYNEKGFPKGYKSGEPVDEARVFRYTSYKLIKEYKDQ
jgi:hypothetical protein